MSAYDVIVVGAGPGGCATARAAARVGLRVALLDRARFPRDKVCGDAITPLGIKMLAQAGLLDAVRAVADAELPKLHVSTASGTTAELPTPLLVARRSVLDAALLDAVRPHVDVHEGAAVDRLAKDDGRVCGIEGTRDGARFELGARVVVGADGASSIVARLTGCRSNAMDRTLLATRAYFRDVASTGVPEFHFLPALGGGYLWIFPAGRNLFNVGLGATASWLRSARRTPRAWCEEVLAAEPFATRFRDSTRLGRFEGGQIPFTGTSEPMSGDGFVLVGDAAGLADAFWGDGIDTALASGMLAAVHVAAAIRAGDVGRVRLSAYDRGIHRVLGPKLALAIERQRSASISVESLQERPHG